MVQVPGGEQGVRGERADRVDPPGAAYVQGGDQGIDFLPAEVSALAGVGVESTHKDPRSCDSKVPTQALVEDGEGVHQAVDGNRRGHGGEGQVGGGEGDAQSLGGEHHYDPLGGGVLGQVFRVAAEGNARLVDDALMNGAGDHGLALATYCIREGFVQGGQHIGGVGGVQLSGGDRRREGNVPKGQVAGSGQRAARGSPQPQGQPQPAGTGLEQGAVCVGNEFTGLRLLDQLDQQVGADPRGLPGGDGDPHLRS